MVPGPLELPVRPGNAQHLRRPDMNMHAWRDLEDVTAVCWQWAIFQACSIPIRRVWLTNHWLLPRRPSATTTLFAGVVDVSDGNSFFAPAGLDEDVNRTSDGPRQ